MHTTPLRLNAATQLPSADAQAPEGRGRRGKDVSTLKDGVPYGYWIQNRKEMKVQNRGGKKERAETFDRIFIVGGRALC
jgi:hypothetical protein